MEMTKKLQLTQHVKERYAERIMGRGAKDIPTFVAQNQEKIDNDIQKMIQYGEVIYCGQLRDKNVVNVILNGTWVVLTDSSCQKVITMYKIDFNLGEEFNKNFIQLQLEKIQKAKEHYLDVVNEVDKKKDEIKSIIENATSKANEYRAMAKVLDSQAENYTAIMKSMDIEKAEAESEIKASIMDLVCKKEF